jgi:hypothetical protein
MTYVVGTMHDDVGAIICDMRVSSGRDGSNDAQKSGVFFPGCIYGASGDVSAIREFIQFCKLALPSQGSLHSFWDEFRTLVSQYNFSDQRGFELLVFNRATGVPRLYKLSSASRELLECTCTTTLGAGKVALDRDLELFENSEFRLLWSGLRATGIPPEAFGFIYCLWLTQRTQGDEYLALEDGCQVGGVFHFLFQTSETENRQVPALYLLCRPDVSCTYAYRVAYERGVLVVHDPARDECTVAADPVALLMDLEPFVVLDAMEFKTSVLSKQFTSNSTIPFAESAVLMRDLGSR